MEQAESEKRYAVLTGDIVGSRKLSAEQLDAVRTRLDWCAGRLNRLTANLVHGRVDVFRGDAWQMLLTEPARALRAAFYARAALLAFEDCQTRIGIGIGPVDRIAEDRISQSMGEAFVLSGRALDEMKPGRKLAIELPEGFGDASNWLGVLLRLCDALAGHWKPRQAEAVLGALEGLTQAQIAERLDPPVSQQAVAKALSGGDWSAIEAALERFETAFGTT
ncbi:MAG: hypothetical protein KO463_04210 [Candidatus Methanofastidiosa archaeon]|nr:hypothetical protein [Candidatus Methanofastidiosa archaeon]